MDGNFNSLKVVMTVEYRGNIRLIAKSTAGELAKIRQVTTAFGFVCYLLRCV